MNIQCFFIVPAGRIKLYLRRFQSSTEKCPGPNGNGYHNAMAYVGEVPEVLDENGCISHIAPMKYADDPRWPAQCAACGYAFKLGDEWQVFQERVYRRADNPAVEMELGAAPPGAIWDADWMRGCAMWTGPDGRALVCRMPGGHDWHIDGRASNCDSPCKSCGKPHALHLQTTIANQPNNANCIHYEDAHPHKCWVRPPFDPANLSGFTVGEGAQGESCGAGAGSILVPGWHGFLRNGVLVQC
jgi:hypothetical protein